MSCNIGLNKAITKILNDKPWFKYKQGDTFIEILESPTTRINKKSSIGVANNLAIAINKLVNKGNKKIGDVVYPAFNSNGWGIVEIRPKSIQLDLINATEIDEINRLQEEIFEEERLKQLEEERLREEELTEEQLENREYFEQDEPYTYVLEEDENVGEIEPVSNIKEGVEELFDSNPELSTIGTQEQYSQYLDTIFPDSKVKDIVYHGTDKEFDKFKKPSNVGSQNRMIAFADDVEYAKIAGNRRTPLKKVISALVNINKLYPVDKLEAMELDSGYRDEVLNELKKEGVDGFAFESDDDLATKNFNEILVFEPEQIHILGNKQDIEGFKKFVNNKKDDKGQFKLLSLNNITPSLIEKERLKFEKEGITLNQKSNIGIINKLIHRSITPANYNKTRILSKAVVSIFAGRDYKDFISTINQWRKDDLEKNVEEENKLIPEWATKITEEQYKKREDAWLLSNGLPQIHNTFKYVGKGFIQNGEIVFDVNGEDIYDFNNFEFNNTDLNRDLKNRNYSIDKSNAVMGKYAISTGRDNTGYFIKYTDRWDLDINNNIIKKIIDVTQNPFIISGKLYKAGAYDTEGNFISYYTSESNNLDIKLYNEFMAMIGTEEVISSDETYPIDNETFQTQANEKTVAAVKEALSKLGISIETSDNLLQQFGANGIAEFSEMLIKLQAGNENIALTEEFMHFVTMMIPESLLEDLMANIEDYKIYKKTLELYKNHTAYQNEDGSPNLKMIKLEAVGKLLAEFYIQKAENLSDKEINAAKTIWGRIKDWISSIFKSNVDVFKDLINNLNNGTLILTEPRISRVDKLYSLDRYNASNTVDQMLKKANEKSNTKVLEEFIALAQSIKEQDLPFILNRVRNISLEGKGSKEDFAYSRKILGDLNPNELKESLTNALNYLMSSYNASKLLNERVFKIMEELDDTTIELTKDEKRYKAIELSNIEAVLQTYQSEFNETSLLFAEDKDSDLKSFLRDAVGDITTSLNIIKNRLEKETFRMLENYFDNTKLLGYKSNIEKDIIRLEKELKAAKTDRVKQMIQSSIDTKRALYETPEISFREIEKILKQGNIEDKSWERFAEGPLTTRNNVIQLITNLLQDINYEIGRNFSEQNADLLKIFLDHNQKFSVSTTSLNTNYDKFLQITTKLTHYKDETTNKLIETQQLELIASLDYTQFENDMEIIKYLKNVKPSDVSSEYEKYFGNKFGEDRPTVENQEEFLNNLISNIYEQNVQKKYTDEYYEIFDILNVTLSDNTTVKERRKEIYDQLDKAKKVLNSSIGSESFYDSLEDVRAIEKILLTFESFYDEQGELKTGDDLVIAETLKKFKEAKQRASEEGKPLFKSFITYTAQLSWEENKKQIDEEFDLAKSEFENGNLSEEEFNELKIKKEQWYAINVVFKEAPEFIEERNLILKQLTRLTSKYDTVSDDNELKISLNEINTTLREIIKLHTEFGTVNGNLASEDTMLQVKNLEQSILDVRDKLNKLKPKMSEDDYEDLAAILEELDDLQSEEVTQHWIDKLESITGLPFEQINLQSLIKHPEINLNVFNVTKQYIDSIGELKKDIPKGFLIKYSEKNPDVITQVYSPTSLWKARIPNNPLHRKLAQPSYKWHSSKINDYYVRETDIKGNRFLKIDSKNYRNSKYSQIMNQNDLEFLEKIRNNYYQDQMQMPESKRMGNVLPFIQASKTLKNKFRFKNLVSPSRWKKAFKGDNLIGKEYLEEEMGLGSFEERRTGGLNKYRIRYKYGSTKEDMLSHEKDLFVLLGSYKYETNRVNAFKQVMPQLNKVRDIIEEGLSKSDKNKNTKLLDDLDFLIEQKVNSKNIKSESRFLAIFRKTIQKIQGITSQNFLFRPWQYTGSIKSFLSSTYAIFQGSTLLRNFSEGSIKKAYISATYREMEYFANELSTIPSKYTAILKRLNVIPEFSERNKLDRNTNMLLKIANNAGYISSAGHRKFAENHATFVMLELYMDGLKKNLVDLYDYDDKTGKVTLKDESFDENKAVSDIRDMAQFVIGNHNSANNPIGKSTILGTFLFMFGNHIANGIFARVGKERVLRSGVKVVPYWNTILKMFKNSATLWNKDTRDANMKMINALMSTDAKSILTHKHLTAEERDGLFRFYKDFLLVNALGGIYYLVSQAMQNMGDDDVEEKAYWYTALVFRKTYSEMNYFNPVEKVALPSRLMFDDEFGYKGENFEKIFNYLLGKKVIEMVTPSLFPGDYRGIRFFSEDIKTKDPYYRQWKNNVLLYNTHKWLKTKQFFDYEYGRQSLRGFEYFDKTVYQGSSDKNKSKKKSDLDLDLKLDLKL